MATGSYLSINTLNVNGFKQKTKTGGTDPKTRPLYMLSTIDPSRNKGHIHTDSEELEKDIPCK